jgi:hypothetical protein
LQQQLPEKYSDKAVSFVMASFAPNHPPKALLAAIGKRNPKLSPFKHK